MAKTFRRKLRQNANIDPVTWRYLHDACITEDHERHAFRLIDLDHDGSMGFTERPAEDLWREFGSEVLTWFAAEQPGTRPSCWWRFTAPEPRRRVGGVGTQRSAFQSRPPYLKMGLPSGDFFPAEDLRWHPWRDGAAAIVPIDPGYPPTFESQASYLARLNLFEPGERERVPTSAFEPEVAPPWVIRR